MVATFFPLAEWPTLPVFLQLETSCRRWMDTILFWYKRGRIGRSIRFGPPNGSADIVGGIFGCGCSHSAGTRQSRRSCVLYNAARDWVKGRTSSFHLWAPSKCRYKSKPTKWISFFLLLFSATTFETNFYSKRIWAVSSIYLYLEGMTSFKLVR